MSTNLQCEKSLVDICVILRHFVCTRGILRIQGDVCGSKGDKWTKLTCTEHMKAPWMQTDFASIHKQASCSNTDRAHLNAPLLFVAFDSATRLRVIGP